MNSVSKLMITSLSLLVTQFAFANDESEDSSLTSQRTSNYKVQYSSSGSTCGDCYEPGYGSEKNCFPGGYNQPAQLQRRYYTSVSASFIYWESIQEGMDIAVSTSVIFGTAPTSPDVGSRFLLQDFKYDPGFRVSFEVDLAMTGWSNFLEYTQYTNTTTVRDPAPFDDGRDENVHKVWETALQAGWNPYDNRLFTAINNTSLLSHWELKYRTLDWGLTRPFYQGTRLTMGPIGGLRVMWISQSFDLSGIFTSDALLNPTPIQVNASSNSWAVGPRGGVRAKWLMMWGFRFEGDFASSLLYTRYNTVQYHAKENVVSPTNQDLGGKYRDYDVLRSVTEMSLGIAWGKYYSRHVRSKCHKAHFDLLASYDFKILPNQNMMRLTADLIDKDVSHDANNLYLHGLTVKGKVDF